MVEQARGAASPARYGFTDDRAGALLRAAGWWDDAGPDESSSGVLVALSRAADPDLALRGLDRIREADEAGWAALSEALCQDKAFRGRLIAVLGTSSALADFLVGSPGEWRRLARDKCTETDCFADELLAAVQANQPDALTGTAAEQALKAAYRGVLLEIAAADLGHVVEPTLDAPSYAEVTGRLTALAEAALVSGLTVAHAELAAKDVDDTRLAIIAMGKCGGRELNYVSDVDVIFVGDGDLQLAIRLASTTMRVVGNACFEVDAALRPEGKAGALVRTLEGHTAYYQKWARTWEFQALLKARAVAGDAELGQRYVEMVDDIVWSAAERENFVEDVQQMRRRVEKHVPSDLVDRELKLGRGGLRDVEFAVQLLQLVHGRADTSLRSASTMDALQALGEGGYVGLADAADLETSYEFLRTVEHRLQLRRLRRTHLFPDASETAELRTLARAVGIKPERGRGEDEVLVADFRRYAQRIRRLHEKLFYRPLLQSVAGVPTEALRLTTKQAAMRLAALGYAAPDGALQHIKALTAGVSRRASIQHALLPVILDLLADTPDPDGGLLAYRKVSEALEETPWYLRVLRDEGAVVERLALLLGTSKLVPDLLVRAPEVLQLLGDPGRLAGREPAEVAKSLRATVRRQPGVKAAVAAARSLRRHEMLRVAAADLLGLLDVRAVCEALSSVWVAVLQSALAAATRKRQAELGRKPANIAVIGMGRLGGAELGYGSDADVLFVCEANEGAEDGEAVRFASSVAETVRQMLGQPSADPPLQVDADLRPEGRGGPLVRTLESYRAYYARWGEVWEAQALLRARYIAGDDDLGERFIEMIDKIRYPEGGLDATRVREVRRMKARVQTERIPRGTDPNLNTKLGRGGLADVEWTVQLLQLRHAHELPALRTTATPSALSASVDAGLMDPQDAASLTEAWLLATRVRNATMLVRGKASDQVPSSGRDLAAVARVLGYSDEDDPGEFLDYYRRTTRRAHAIVERVFFQD
ncbi:bifunctional [glutamine synthetase] adenylyltransferase/[glutamine synthetase]-adenylyl-L-tyrosine phosphorylase [Amycolatopsis acidiphila]|uniref:Bifunctional glutamine synthetase adenylyltransferase/adenylyl-removing enzyme n=1 Tax=Amycolatopsis acidiphila TaxID=715473 RepID=A0A557ZVP1_9PSEU|nr:bifunctional [glutamine synthetase] adenylyltransferase/[glutamine synthetase]-adenylyl-L-tyrosine phosphorylase [Amycolatopsis acidiphila]TVT16082.1 bifunctional [glutamine synthetase] adenylyltransferase/[glutamine synthetase]-adenylyl-L-tyrosine phosphorylase [Amycolatopsis acidiphila]UIJ61063.1 bifunctional [glutamine synthetase] adenylyltransferase/[glutamine synthetase]-adenylyl-L-tyrosine phosphorylase [Amycolatopsis acidiphila]GHG87006.1 glutamate-ammonia-ligase adenylyltransferase [A